MTVINQQTILAVETCTPICSVALWDGRKMHEHIIEVERSHSKQILPLCDKVLGEANLTMRDVQAIACTRGPGSFTGLRIGVGVAKGLAFGQDLPIYAVSSLQALAYRVILNHANERVMAVLDARMGELYCGEYENIDGFPQPLGDDYLTDAEHLHVKGRLCAGTGVHEYSDMLTAKGATLSPILYPTARDVIAVAMQGDIAPISASALTPVYLRDKVTDS